MEGPGGFFTTVAWGEPLPAVQPRQGKLVIVRAGVARNISVRLNVLAAKPPPGHIAKTRGVTPMMFSRGFRAGMQWEKEEQPATPAPGESSGLRG